MQVENSLTDTRVEVVEETTVGETPSNPEFQTVADDIQELTYSPGGNRETQTVVGSGDQVTAFRGPEEPEVTLSYYKQRPFVDSGGDPNYLAARPLTFQYDETYPSYTFEYRREVVSGGNFNSGFREYIVARGCKPTEVTLPGDPSEAEPIVEELTLPARGCRPFVVHQPDSATTLDVTNNGSTSVDVTIENEGASTTETVTVSGGSTVTTTESFADIDVIFAESEPDGDIEVTDGGGTAVLDSPLAGTSTTNVDGERGIPPLGTGSRGTAVGTDPADYLFLGVDTVNWDGSSLSDRVHALDLTVTLESSREPVAGTRESRIDIGSRTAEADAEIAGPYESAEAIADQFRNRQGDFVYSLPENDVTLQNAQISEAPDIERTAGDTNYVPGVTFIGLQEDGNAAITVTNTA